MTKSIHSLMTDIISSGLKRKSVTSCSKWAENYRVMGSPFPGPWNFDHHPWLLEMHDSTAHKRIGQKAAQMGYTEWAMNTAFYSIDVRGLDVLYVLPTASDASDFSAGRFDPALEMSPHLRNMFSSVNNVGLKRAGSNILYVRGSHSRSKLKSIPTPILVFDEIDEMPRSAVTLAEERQSGQMITEIIQLSTPTIEDYGINIEFKNSTQSHFFFKCPSCSRLTELVWPDCLVVTAEAVTDPGIENSHLICKECKNKLPHETKPDWLKHKKRGGTAHFIPAHTDRDVEGFHVSQLYSMVQACSPVRLARAQLIAQRDPTAAQEFHNSKLGRTFETDGARVSKEQLSKTIKGYKKGPIERDSVLRTIGIDVGAVLHIVVKEFTQIYRLPSINDSCNARVLFEGTSSGSPTDFDEAFEIFMDYHVHGGVVDAEPERRAALQFAQRAFGRIYLCDYMFSQQGREVKVDEDDLMVKCNRTSWMDLSLGRYKNGSIELPLDVSHEFQLHIREPVRVYREDKWGQPYAVYVSAKADHFAHADVYAELALPVAASFLQNTDIRGLF